MNVEGAFVQDSRSSWISDVSRSMNSDSSDFDLDIYKVRQTNQLKATMELEN